MHLRHALVDKHYVVALALDAVQRIFSLPLAFALISVCREHRLTAIQDALLVVNDEDANTGALVGPQQCGTRVVEVLDPGFGSQLF